MQSQSGGVQYTVTNGTSYDLRIRSVSQEDGENNYRESSWVTVSNKVPVGTPEAPADVILTPGVERLTVSWTAPSAGGSAITGYDVHYKTWNARDSAGTGSDPSTGWIAATHADTTTTVTVTGLTGGEAYYVVRVRAENANGSGPWSASEPLWSARLTVGSGLGLAESGGVGCQSSTSSTYRCSSTSILTDDDFPSGTVTVRVLAIADLPSGLLFEPNQPATGFAGMTFCVGTTAYAIDDAGGYPALATAVRWSGADVGWSVNDQVILRLQQSDSCAGVTVRSSDATLSALTASSSTGAAGPFSTLSIGAFSSTTTSYTATVANTITHVKLTPTVNDTGKATVTVQGTTVPSGSASNAIALSVGSNTLTVRVTAQDSTTQDYTVTITREPAVQVSTVPTGLAVTAGDAELTARWTAPTGVDVARYEAQIKLKSAANWPNTDTDVTGTSHTFTSLVNGSTYQVRVRTVQTGEQTPSAWTNPAEGTPQAQQSSNANLSGLTASSATGSTAMFTSLTLSPAFSASRTSYTATVANARTHAKLTPTVADTGKATVTVQGSPVSSGSASGAIALNQGANAITVRVTAENSSTKDYTVTITRQAPPVTPTVRLSASPNPVDEGSPVTVTATLSAAAASSVTIPLTLTDDTAEPEDHGTLASITIAANATSGSGAIATNQDPDADDETFTVALGALPSSVAAGTPSSVRVRIRDDEGDSEPPPGDDDTDDPGDDEDPGDGDDADDPPFTCTLAAPYWSGPTGGFTVMPSPDGTSVSVTCGARTTEYEAENGLVTRLVRGSCPGGLRLEGAAPGGWYWQHGERNAAAAPFVCSEGLAGPRAVVPGGVVAEATDDATYFRHDTSRLVGIVPHLAGNECSEYVTPYWQGNGGVVLRPAEGRSTARIRVQCGGTWSTLTASAGADGVAAELVRKDYCTDAEGNPLQGRLTVTGAAPGGWYWVDGERNGAAAPLMCADLLGGPAAVEPGGVFSRATEDATYFMHHADRLIGVVPHLAPPPDSDPP